MSSNPTPPRIGLRSALSLVITSMVGTGVFTSLGFQLESLTQASTVVALWLLGGVIALCGAAVYAELGGLYPGSGGEFNFLTRLFHPLVGFLAGWISTVVGFSAPIALAAMAFGAYVTRLVPNVPETAAAAGAVVVMAVIHARGVRLGLQVQRWVTATVLAMVLLLIGVGVMYPSGVSLAWQPSTELFSASFAVSLIYVEYAYSGWNAAAYIAGEMERPERDLPRALIGGTALVCVLYLALNLTFLRSAPADDLRGKVDVAYIAAEHFFGPAGARLMSVLLAGVLLGSVSSMLFAGARIPAVMAEGYTKLGWLHQRNAAGAPSRAVALQAAMALTMVATGSFQSVLTFIGFLLTACTTLAVAGLFVARARGVPSVSGYRCLGYPLTPMLFLVVNGWMLVFALQAKPVAGLVGLAVILTGIPVWWWLDRQRTRLNAT